VPFHTFHFQRIILFGHLLPFLLPFEDDGDGGSLQISFEWRVGKKKKKKMGCLGFVLVQDSKE
jgi:hypothetical protein